MKQSLLLVTLLSVSIVPVVLVQSRANNNKKNNNSPSSKSSSYDLNPFVKDEDTEKSFGEMFPTLVKSSLTTLYGSALLVHSHKSPGQVHCLTMFRSTGHEKLEKAAQAWKENVKDAVYKAVYNAPSLLMARRSLQKQGDRISYHKKIVKAAKKAKSDGRITRGEARKLKKLRRKEIANLKRDMRRLVRAGASLKVVIQALDFDELKDIVKGMCFQLLSVLSTGHNDNKIGQLISRWCLFLNLGSLVVDVIEKLDFPIAKLLTRTSLTKSTIDDMKTKEAEKIQNAGKAIVAGASAYLVVKENELARKLNAALLASAVMMRGMKDLVKAIIDWDDDDDDGIWPAVGQFLEGSTGGLLMISLATTCFVAQDKAEKGELHVPEWVTKPMNVMEDGIHKLGKVLNEFV